MNSLAKLSDRERMIMTAERIKDKIALMPPKPKGGAK